MMNHRIIGGVAVLATALGMAGVGSEALATPPADVHIEVPTLFSDAPVPFTATGPAVAGGVVCAAGSVQTLAQSGTGGSQAGINFHVLKEFTCEGGGTFQIKLEVRFDRKGDNFRWVIMNGTGPYASLRGSGSGIGLPLPDENLAGVLDVYDGRAHTN